MTDPAESKATLTRDILGSIGPVVSVLATILGGAYFLVIEPTKRDLESLETRLDKIESRLVVVEKEQQIRTGTIERFRELKAWIEREIQDIRAKLAEMRSGDKRP